MQDTASNPGPQHCMHEEQSKCLPIPMTYVLHSMMCPFSKCSPASRVLRDLICHILSVCSLTFSHNSNKNQLLLAMQFMIYEIEIRWGHQR